MGGIYHTFLRKFPRHETTFIVQSSNQVPKQNFKIFTEFTQICTGYPLHILQTCFCTAFVKTRMFQSYMNSSNQLCILCSVQRHIDSFYTFTSKAATQFWFTLLVNKSPNSVYYIVDNLFALNNFLCMKQLILVDVACKHRMYKIIFLQ